MTHPTTGGAGSATLSRELADFLIELSIGLHKNAIYPPGHPLLEGATTGIARRLEALLQGRSSLSLGVAREQLIIEGVATDENNPVLRDLAQRLHRHHLGAVKFTAGVTAAEIADALATIAVDVGRRPRPLGLEGEDVLQKWEHVRLFPLTFEQLQLLDEEPSEESDQMRGDKSRAAQLWIGLARAAIAAEADSDGDAAESTDPVLVAKAIDEHKKDAAYDQVVVGYLLQIAEELKAKGGKDAAALQKRISRLVATLQPETLSRLLRMGGDVNQRRKFVLDAAQGMAVDAVVELVQAAADTSGQNVSHSLVRMLSKLAVHADEGAPLGRAAADVALRDSVHKLISDWTLDDPNPDGYRRALEKMSLATPAFQTGDDAYPCEPERLLAMGIEIQMFGDPVQRSVAALSNADDLRPLLTLLDQAPEGWMRDALWREVATPDVLHRQLERHTVDLDSVERLVARMGLAAVPELLDALEIADDRQAAAYVDMVVRQGADAALLVAERTDGARASQLRLLLTIIAKLGVTPPGFDIAAYTRHVDATVRREALRSLIRDPRTREDAIATALGDPDERIVRLALGAAMTNCPAEASRILLARADDPSLSPDLRALGIRAAASCPTPDVLSFLLARTTGKRRFLRRQALAAPTPEVLAALAGLATHWASDPAARELLDIAARSSDKDVRDAVARRTSNA
ncbi:MAG TPA: hypothetical protein VG916_12705 [Gemmatimonadaceae bacterium]|nr:hypothetical protein [Gemmatimonadaceae bacterium]